VRIESQEGRGRVLDFRLEPGRSLNDAVATPLTAAGFRAAAVQLGPGRLCRFRYVLPALSPDASHAAYYSEPVSADGAEIEIANATFGLRDGAPFIHCHALWTESGGNRRAGHVLPDQSVVAEAIEARAWGSAEIRIRADRDPETNFTLFHPVLSDGATDPGAASRIAVARVRPDEDITEALEAVCRAHGFRRAIVRGSLGSLIGAEFEDGRVVEDIATELLVLKGDVTPNPGNEPRGRLKVVLADMQARRTRGGSCAAATTSA
jgi:predicted DNA-binding protein with PD1-like motif